MGTGHCLPGVRTTSGEDRGEGGTEIYSHFLKTLLNTFSPSFAEPKTPLGSSQEHPEVLSIFSQPLFISRCFLHYRYIPSVDGSLSQLHTSLFSHLSRTKYESQQRATQSSCNLVEHKKIPDISLNIYEFIWIKATEKNSQRITRNKGEGSRFGGVGQTQKRLLERYLWTSKYQCSVAIHKLPLKMVSQIPHWSSTELWS